MLRLSLVLVFPTVGLAQVLHTSGPILVSQPLYQALHWLSDGLLALPLGVAAIWGGQHLATRLGYGRSTPSAIAARVCLIGLLYALLLVPGAALHEVADSLTHAHSELTIQTHGAPTPGSIADLAAIGSFAIHALADGLAGLAIGLPAMYVALWWRARGGRKRWKLGGTRKAS